MVGVGGGCYLAVVLRRMCAIEPDSGGSDAETRSTRSLQGWHYKRGQFQEPDVNLDLFVVELSYSLI